MLRPNAVHLAVCLGKGPRAGLRALDGRHPHQRRSGAGIVMIGRFAALRPNAVHLAVCLLPLALAGCGEPADHDDPRTRPQRRSGAGIVMIGRFAAAREGQRQEADGKMDGVG
jgi:uncharacterized membrane protein